MLKNVICLLMDMPKTLYFNFSAFDFWTALKLPVYVKRNVKIGKIYKNVISFNHEPTCFMINIGQKGVFNDNAKSFVTMTANSHIRFNGKAVFAQGINIQCNSGSLTIGNNFYCNSNVFIQCEYRIDIGNDNLWGWNISVRDTDGHLVTENGIQKQVTNNIVFGNHIWVGSDVTVLKGTVIGDGTIVATRACVCGHIFKQNQLIAGIPACVIKDGVAWKK